MTTDVTRVGPQDAAYGIEVSYDDDATLVRLSGEIDAAASETLDQVDDEVVRARPRLVVDLSAVTFLDSIGVSFLVRLATQARAQDRSVSLREVPPPVGEVLALVGATELFDVNV